MKTQTIRDKVQAYGLSRNKRFDKSTPEELERVWNGCGAEWFPPQARKVLTEALAIFSPAFLVHDWDFAFRRDSYHTVNWRMFRNMLRIIWVKFALRLPLRSAYWVVIAINVYWLVSRYGWTAWKE